MLFAYFFYLAISILVLVKSADYFTSSAEKIGAYLKLPPFVVGVTIVSVGTSLPELITSMFAAAEGQSPIVIGNVVGSNIANIFLVLGLASVVSGGLSTEHDVMKVDLPMIAASAFLLFVCSYDGRFDYGEGIVFIAALAIYMFYAAKSKKVSVDKEEKITLKTILSLVFGVVFLDISARYTVHYVVVISHMLHITTAAVAASVVALGTSLPELMVSLNAARKGNLEMSIGNVIGSNIFNTFGIMGFSSFIATINIDRSTIHLGLPVMLIATVLLIFSLQNKAMSRWMGYIFLIFYVLYILKLFNAF